MSGSRHAADAALRFSTGGGGICYGLPVSEKQRADLLLVRRGLFDSRRKAQDAIAAGRVAANGAVVRRAAEALPADAALSAASAHPWVSRGGLKLEAGLDAFGFEANTKICLDIGASTGGFTQVLLSRGAAKVYAVDVGCGQLHPTLRADPRVVAMEGTDARALTAESLHLAPDIITCDVSFISLRLVLPGVLPIAAPAAKLVCLIKPQFEAGRSRLVKGIVKDPAAHAAVCHQIECIVDDLGWSVLRVIPSPIDGVDGNREFLLGASRL
ncbi:MAG: TlyA family RNA methyltransferase [Methylobacteriaceae bacterium]|nr:TlyA family RNA methyltransferase [Methylobacteriaceae bacterium]